MWTAASPFNKPIHRWPIQHCRRTKRRRFRSNSNRRSTAAAPPSECPSPRILPVAPAADRRKVFSTPLDEMGTRLSEDLIVEILSRLPVKSLRRFICVCRRWRHLILYSDDRRRLPQTLAGFFCTGADDSTHFVDIFPSPRPLFKNPLTAFLPSQGCIRLFDCCNGLLLCRWTEISPEDLYIVCNPATEKWVALPGFNDSTVLDIVRLVFDPAVSPHFRVLEVAEHTAGPTTGVDVYSSETGRWIHKEAGWNQEINPEDLMPATVFLNDRLYFKAFNNGLNNSCIATVDMKMKGEETWTKFPVPGGLDEGCIQLSQGRLHYACFQKDGDGAVKLKVYFLQDHDSQEWILKHSIESSHLFGEANIDYTIFNWAGMHLEGNLFFFIAGRNGSLMCYNMDRQQVDVIHDHTDVGEHPYFPYVPLYSELPALQM